MKTRTNLIHRALRNLGVLPAGQTPSDEEYDSVDTIIDSIVDELTQRDVYFLQDADAIPDEAFLPLGHILASACRAEFGLANDPALVALGQRAELDLDYMQNHNHRRQLATRTMRSDFPTSRRCW